MTTSVSPAPLPHGARPQHIAIVRHGETDWNLAGRIQGRTEIPLNDTGRAQAAATGAALMSAAPALGAWERLYASPLGRASETAAIIATELGLPAPRIDEGLWERDFGSAEGVCVPEVHDRWPGLDIPDAESLEALADRSAAAFTRIHAAVPGAVVVAHGAMIRAGLARLTGAPMPRIANGEVWLLSLAETPTGAARYRASRLTAD